MARNTTVRRSVALPCRLVDDARAFQQALAEMASDPALQSENTAILREFSVAESDGLRHS